MKEFLHRTQRFICISGNFIKIWYLKKDSKHPAKHHFAYKNYIHLMKIVTGRFLSYFILNAKKQWDTSGYSDSELYFMRGT